MNAMKATIAGNKNRYIIKSSIGGITDPITVAAAIIITINITGPNMAINM
jgi:hypothetical protein